MHRELAALDIGFIILYLLFAVGVGLFMRFRKDQNLENFFLAGRSIPWWWVGISIAATTFAADTPLAVTGIVAKKGISGNWMWLAWMGMHAAVVLLFAKLWSRSGVVTDAELIDIRYSNPLKSPLRLFRATLSGVVANCIVLGWVLKAMVKISEPFFHWEVWTPSLHSFIADVLPASSELGTASEVLTVILLVALVALYSSLGGLKAVVFTDLVQFVMALVGGLWLAIEVWGKVGGGVGLRNGLIKIYGENHDFLQFFPTTDTAWIQAMHMGSVFLMMYLFVQSFASLNGDGGGYIMQRLNAAKTPLHAQRGALLFMVFHYLIRIWPWFVVAIGALVIYPRQGELSSQLDPKLLKDAELAYPMLMAELLPTGVLGLVLASLLAAFMSTVDTHINWGASYISNDWYRRFKPQASEKELVRVGRFAVIGFAIMAILVSFKISFIEKAWQWVALMGGPLGVPTCLRWIWWRINVECELLGMTFGLITAVVLSFMDYQYEYCLIGAVSASFVGVFIGVLFGKKNEAAVINQFMAKVSPIGFWPGRSFKEGIKELINPSLRWGLLITSIILIFNAMIEIIFFSNYAYLVAVFAGVTALVWIFKDLAVTAED